MERQRLSDPLVLLNAAVIVGIQVGQTLVFIQRILLHVNPGRVDVGTQNVHALAHGLLADDEEHNVLLHPHPVHPVTSLELFTLGNDLIQVTESSCFGQLHSFGNALPLRFAVVQERNIALAQRFHLLQCSFVIAFPGILFIHGDCHPFRSLSWQSCAFTTMIIAKISVRGKG